MIGRGEMHIYCSLLGDFCTENIIKNEKKKELSSTEQTSNETVARNSWRHLFTNPDRKFCEITENQL